MSFTPATDVARIQLAQAQTQEAAAKAGLQQLLDNGTPDAVQAHAVIWGSASPALQTYEAIGDAEDRDRLLPILVQMAQSAGASQDDVNELSAGIQRVRDQLVPPPPPPLQHPATVIQVALAAAAEAQANAQAALDAMAARLAEAATANAQIQSAGG